MLAALTAAFLPFRGQLDKLNIAFTFLLVVLGGSAVGGRALGLSLAGIAYLDFHYFFVERYDSLAMARPLDALVLLAFIVTSVVAEQLLTRAIRRAEQARQRAEEVERLAAIGSETLHAGRAEDALTRLLEVIRTELRVDRCDIIELRQAPPQSEPWPDARTLVIPLVVRGTSIGLLRLAHASPFTLAPEQRRFLDVLSYYAALGLERVHLVAEAERADAFRQADALKSAMIAGFSHDLRTPLTTIKALAANLRSRAIVEGASIEEEADRLNRLVTDLLDLSRLDAQAMPIRPELNTAEDLIGAAVQRLSGTEGSHRIAIVPAATDAEPLVGEFDFVHALRALVNLIENALKYSPPDTTVEVRVERDAEWLVFHVSDRGPGIGGDDRERVFEPFYRAPGHAVDIGGAGLGLAIARRLAREQGGDVRHEHREGGGSTFTLTLRASDVAV
jgi:two-component system sensor histidine kinase KdpD